MFMTHDMHNKELSKRIYTKINRFINRIFFCVILLFLNKSAKNFNKMLSENQRFRTVTIRDLWKIRFYPMNVTIILPYRDRSHA